MCDRRQGCLQSPGMTFFSRWRWSWRNDVTTLLQGHGWMKSPVSDTTSDAYCSRMAALAADLHLHNVDLEQCPAYSLLMSHVRIWWFSWNVHSRPTMHQHWYQLCELVFRPLSRITNLFLNQLWDISHSPTGGPPFQTDDTLVRH